MSNSAIALLRGAREKTIKARAIAIANATAAFDKELKILDEALQKLAASSATTKKTPSKKAVKKATPKKAVKKDAPKKPVPKKAAPVKKSAGGYPLSGSVQERLTHVIGQAKRFLSIAEIGEMVKKHERGQKVEKIKRRFSKHMDKFRKSGGVVSYTDGGKTYYGLPAYVKDGKPLDAHKHKAL
jgi:hypothetical protein